MNLATQLLELALGTVALSRGVLAGIISWSAAALVPTLIHGRTTGKALHASGVTEADVIRYVGVFVALAGAVIAAPGGARRLLGISGDWLRSEGRWLCRQIRRLLPFRARHHPPLRTSAVGDAGAGGDVLDVDKMTRTWDANLPAWVKVERLHEQVEDIIVRVRQIWKQMQAEDSRIREELTSVVTELRDADRAIRLRLDQAERRAAQIDARGILLIGLGIVLTGIPTELAAWHPLGWIMIGLTGVATLRVVWLAWQDRERDVPTT